VPLVQVWQEGQLPQSIVPPQPSSVDPQAPLGHEVIGVHVVQTPLVHVWPLVQQAEPHVRELGQQAPLTQVSSNVQQVVVAPLPQVLPLLQVQVLF
jgi:hypothetical protein